MAKDLTNIYKNYKGKWVALTSSDEVVASGKSIKVVVSKAEEKGVKKPILFKVPAKIVPYIGSF